VAERYEEVERDSYRGGRRGTRDYEELDLEFLREDYGRNPNAGPLVIRDSRRVDDRRPEPRRTRSVEREDITIRHRDRDSYRRDAEREEIDVTVKHDSSRPPRRREIERDEDFYVRRGSGRRPDRVEKEEIIVRHDDRGRDRNELEHVDDIRIRHRSKSRQRQRSLPPRRVERDNEEIVVSHRHRQSRDRSRSSSHSRRGRIDTEEIIIRRREERSPSPRPPPTPEPVIIPTIVRPPIHEEIHREIITHHRHIDHGVQRARARTPSPLPPPRIPTPPRKVEETIEVDIRHRHRGGREHDDQIIIRERSRDGRIPARPRMRARSSSAGPRRRYFDDDSDAEAEAAYYNRKAMERAYPGEARNGATRDWAIVDVPPGTERVRMDGAGGGSQEITWQRYNGVRRSKFLTGGEVIDSGFGIGDGVGRRDLEPVAPKRAGDMWTEVTKDLVLRDAIESFGYEYEETEFFFYIMDYLRYEDVLELVELSDDIRSERRRRIRELEWEREDIERRRRYDDRVYEREVIVDNTIRRRH